MRIIISCLYFSSLLFDHKMKWQIKADAIKMLRCSEDISPGLTGSCVVPTWTLKQKQQGNTGTSSHQQLSSSTDRWLQFKCPQPKRMGEIFHKKICPFRKKTTFFWPGSGSDWEGQREGTEMEHLLSIWSSGEFDARTSTSAIFAGSLSSPQSQK